MNDPKLCIPQQGIPKEEVLEQMQQFRGEDANYKDGKTWSLVYYLGEEHTKFIKQAHNLFFSENGLNPMAFKSLKRFEAEVVRMSANLLSGDESTVGTMSSGGTESIFLSVKTYRDWARSKKSWLFHPEIIIPESAHVAFDKAGHYLGVKIVRAPLTPGFTVDIKAVKRLINRRTIALVGSAPQYPQGVIDPIDELGELAQKKGLGLHVDACLGGFLLPFVEKLGYAVRPFDFRVPGVTSMSADIHKYGFAAKGASVILYRDMEFLRHQFYVNASWSGGIYASPSFPGTRPGGPIAAAWAALKAIGEEGYLGYAKQTMDISKQLQFGVRSIPELEVLGAPSMSVFAFRSRDRAVDIYALCDQMEKRGWHINRQQKPESAHLMVTPAHAQSHEAYIADLKDCVAFVKANPQLSSEGSAPMYGMMAKLPFRGMIKKSILKIMEGMYSAQGQMPDLENQDEDLAARLGASALKLKQQFDDSSRQVIEKAKELIKLK